MIKKTPTAIAPGLLPAIVVASPLVVQLSGDFTFLQQSNGNFLDAHEGTNDNNVVTRNDQGNAPQLWIVKPVSEGVYTIQQRSNGRYLDAHGGVNDNSVVTRDP